MFRCKGTMKYFAARLPHAILWRIPPVLLLISFLVPSMGVMFNHHFPDQNPYHSHFANGLKHGHVVSGVHTHGRASDSTSSNVVLLVKNVGMSTLGAHIGLIYSEIYIPPPPIALIKSSILTIDIHDERNITVETPPPIL